MSGTFFKEVSYSLNKLIEDIELGEIGLPDIQRPFIWTNAKVRDLFDSMYKGFPVGYLLFWANGLPGGHRQIGTDAKQKIPRLLIVDGQQRLTSLFAVLKGIRIVREDFSKERVYIAFRPSDRKFEVTDAAVRRDPAYIPDISMLWSGETTRNRFVKDFLARLRGSHEISEAQEGELTEAIDRLYDLQSYPFTALELSHSVDEEAVAEVFVRINSKGTPLNQADFILTLMSVFWDEGRAELEAFCRSARQPSISGPSPFNHFIQPDPDQLLRVSVALGFRRARLQHVYSILRGKDLETGEFSEERRTKQFEVLKKAQTETLDLQDWHEFLKVLLRAGYRAGTVISSKVGLLYNYAFFLLGRRVFGIDLHILRDVMARWFFMTALTGRYTTSPETAMEQDLGRFADVQHGNDFIALLDGIVGDSFTEDYWNITLPSELATASARSPSLFAYYAALNLLDARVLFSKLKVSELFDPASKGHKAALERHHLFPKGYLNMIGVKRRREVNQIANYALVEWSENIKISSASPAEYFPKYASRFSPNELKQMLYWHALPDGWHEMSYQDLLVARRKAMAGVIRDGFQLLAGSGDESVGPAKETTAKAR